MKRRMRNGFTLVELLVVIAILAVLFTLVAGSVLQAKGAAKRVVCMNNLKQWGQATHLYLADNRDLLPREAAHDGINTWEMTASEFSRDVWYNALAVAGGTTAAREYAQTPSSQQDFYEPRSLFRCPGAKLSPVSATYPNFSLAMNSKLMFDFEVVAPGAADPLATKLLLSEIKIPARTALMLDAGVPGEPKICEFQTTYTGQPKVYADQFPGRHNRGGNILFAAGQVVTLPGKRVVEMNPESVHRGRGIFPPGEIIWTSDPELVP